MPYIGSFHVTSAKRVKALEAAEKYHQTMHDASKTTVAALQATNAELRGKIQTLEKASELLAKNIHVIRRSAEEMNLQLVAHNQAIAALASIMSEKPGSKEPAAIRSAWIGHLGTAITKVQETAPTAIILV